MFGSVSAILDTDEESTYGDASKVSIARPRYSEHNFQNVYPVRLYGAFGLLVGNVNIFKGIFRHKTRFFVIENMFLS